MRKACFTLFAMLLLVCFAAGPAAAEQLEYVNPTTHYRAVLIDSYDLLDPTQEVGVLAAMKPITEYGNIAFYSCYNTYSQSEVAENARLKRRQLFGTAEGSIFMIDMKARYMYIQSYYGYMLDTISPANAEEITNHARQKMQDKNYAGAAVNVFGEMYTLLKGGEIVRPMKTLSNAVIAAMLGLLLALLYTILARHAVTERLATPQYLSALTVSQLTDMICGCICAIEGKITEERVYKPVHSDSSGCTSCSSCSDSDSGSSCSSCSGGGSSCSSCGGGGGSSF